MSFEQPHFDQHRERLSAAGGAEGGAHAAHAGSAAQGGEAGAGDEGAHAMTPAGDGSRAARSQEEIVWAFAAQLTSGLLANPSKGHFSVKDTISLFDEVLHELTSYARVRGDFSEYARGAMEEEVQRRHDAHLGRFLTEHPLRRKPRPLPGTPGAAGVASEDDAAPVEVPRPLPEVPAPYPQAFPAMPELPDVGVVRGVPVVAPGEDVGRPQPSPPSHPYAAADGYPDAQAGPQPQPHPLDRAAGAE